MPSINLNLVTKNAPVIDRNLLWNSTLYAQAAVHFCALASIAQSNNFDTIWLSLYATAIELSLKSIAMRLGATSKECFGHKVTKLVRLIESKGGKIPTRVRNFLVFDHLPIKTVSDCKKPRWEKDVLEMDDDELFEALMIDSRYPDMGSQALIHDDYVGLITDLLEAESPYPFVFAGGNARAEIEMAIKGKKAANGMTYISSSQRDQTDSHPNCPSA